MLTLEIVEKNLDIMRNRLLEKRGERNVLTEQRTVLIKKIQQIKIDIQELIQSKELLLDTIKFARDEAKFIIESLVTSSLQFVFNDPTMGFEIEIRDLANTTECNFILIEKGERLDPMESNGGGVVDVISFILRIALIQASNKISLEEDSDEEPISNLAPLVLDEPFKHLSKEHIPRVGEFLREITDQLEIQIIIVTHNEELAKYADKKFTVIKGEDDISYVKEYEEIA